MTPMEEHKSRLWSVTLTPHRSLTREGFVVLMVIIVLINFVGGLLFLVSGAWPVAGFMGLDVLLIWWAFRQNFADGKCAERITVRDDLVILQRLSTEGASETLEFNRRWLKVELEFDEAREIVGTGPVYVTYDIDFVDPTFAPGTGTPEVGGPNSWQALQVARGLRGLDVVGADLVEVSPPFDPAGGTAWLGASLMFEMLCVMAEGIARG